MSQPVQNLPSAANPSSIRQPQDTPLDVEEFINLVSHDLRGSIRALLELPDWIAEDIKEAGLEVGTSVLDSIALMKRHTRRLDRMLIDLQQYSRAGVVRNIHKVDLQDAFDAAMEEIRVPDGFRLAPQFRCNSLLICDRDLHLLLTALIGNAIKHHDRFSGVVEVQGELEGAAFVLMVSDDGPGILPQFHERVFQPMTTLRARDVVEGSGLGLALVRKIAGIYGGDARLLSPGDARGTSVEVRLQGVAL
jgi:signal transduction histidine kinase